MRNNNNQSSYKARLSFLNLFSLLCVFFAAMSLPAIAQEGSGYAASIDLGLSELDDDYDPNIAPSIKGDPQLVAIAGEPYVFAPVAKDADQDSLRYSVVNLPEWAFFDSANGRLGGTPFAGDVGSYGDIVISVNDGLDAATLEAFTLTVQASGSSSLGTSFNAGFTSTGVSESNSTVNASLSETGSTLMKVQNEHVFRLAPNTQPGTVVGRLTVPGFNSDTIRYALEMEHAVFALESDGRLILRQRINHNETQQYQLRVLLSDGQLQSAMVVSVVLGAGNGVWQQRWDDLPGGGVHQLSQSERYPDSPSDTTVIPTLAVAKAQVADVQIDDVGYRLISYLKPAASGLYQFALNGAAELGKEAEIRLSTDHLAVNATALPSEPESVIELVSGQKSSETIDVTRRDKQTEFVLLDAGQVYFLEVLYKQALSNEQIVVGWRRDGEKEFAAIPGSELYLDGLSVGLVKPEILPFDSDVLLDSAARTGDVVARIPAIDLQGDTLNFAIEDVSLPFSIDPFGVVRVSGHLAASSHYRVRVNVSDGTHVTATNIDATTSAENSLELALHHGDASLVTSQMLLNSANEVVADQLMLRDDIRKAVFAFSEDGRKSKESLNAINWDPTDRSVVFEPHSATGMIPLLVSNAAVKESTSHNEILAMAGQSATGARRALLGSNALHDMSSINYPNGSGNEQMNGFLRNLITWLVGSDEMNETPVNIVVAHQADSYYFKHDNSTSRWLTMNFPDARFNPQDVCEGEFLKACLDGADLLIIGQENGQNDNHGIEFDLPTTIETVALAHEAGLPILYLPHGGEQNELGQALSDYFGVTTGDNFWRQERLIAYNPHAEKLNPAHPLIALPRTLNKLAANQLDFTFDDTNCPEQGGVVHCYPNLVTGKDGLSLQETVHNGIASVSQAIAAADVTGNSIFTLGYEYTLEKLALLIADKYRQQVRYPMDKHGTDDTTLMRALFADDVVSYVRADNAQPLPRAANRFSRTVRSTPSSRGDWFSTGLYASPGEIIRVTRNDTGDYALGLRFNRLRASPQIWNRQGYSRSRSLNSNQVTLSAGQSYSLSTPYGGVIYLWSDGKVRGTEPYTVTFENVVASPKLSRNDTASIQVFASELNASPSDWVDIETPYIELHTLKTHLEQALVEQDGDLSNGYTLTDIRNYYNNINSKLIKSKLTLLGYTNNSLPSLSSNLNRYCAASGLSNILYENRYRNLCTDGKLHRLPTVQHISSDTSDYCGDHCAPDTIYSSSPIRPADVKLNRRINRLFESKRLLIDGTRSRKALSDVLSLYTNWSAANTHDSQALARGLLSDLNATMQFFPDDYTEEIASLAFYLQLVLSQQSHDYFTQLYLVDRIFSHAVLSEQRWLAARDALGFGLYSREHAYAMNGNDFIYIATSSFSNKDHRNLFNAWNVDVSTEAVAQVAFNSEALEDSYPYYQKGPIQLSSE